MIRLSTKPLRRAGRGRCCIAVLLSNACLAGLGPLAPTLAAQASGRASASAEVSPERYQDLVEKGLAAFDAGQLVVARELFARAHALAPSARTQRALGMTDMALDNYGLAREELTRALESKTLPLTAEQAEEVSRLLTWMYENLGILRLHYTPPGSRAQIDAKPISSGDVYLAPGPHQLEISAPGFKPYAQSFQLLAVGAPLELRVVLEPQLVMVRASQAWMWLGGGSLLAAAASTGLLIAGQIDIAKAEDPDRHDFIGVAARTGQRGVRMANAGWEVGALAVAGLITSVLLKVYQEPSEDRAQPSERAAMRLSISPMGIEGRF